MAYTEKEKRWIIEEMKRAIEEHRLKFFYQVFAFVPCCKETGTQILKELGELATVKSLIGNQKTLAKVHTLNRWEDSDSATLQIAYYKLLANESELQALNNNKHTVVATVKDTRTEAEIQADIAKLALIVEAERYDISKDNL